jgi:hypothetical protein
VTRTPLLRALSGAGLASVAAAALLAGCSGGDDPVASVTPSATASASASPSSASPSASASPGPSESPSETAAGPTVAEVYRTARTAALSAASGHAEGSQTREGRTLEIDVEGAANGSNQTVFITTDRGTAEVLTVGDRYWLGGDKAFWVEQTGDAAAGARMVGKYVPINESDATELGSFTLRSILTEKFALPEFAALESDSSPAMETEIGGRAAYLLGEEGGARLWVASDGSGALLRAVGPKTAPSDLVFSNWDRAERFAPPPASKVVDEG